MKNIVLKLIKVYQKHSSSKTVSNCRFRPTCSQYSYEAISKYGVIKGGLKSLWRILRCNPFSKGGYDPVK